MSIPVSPSEVHEPSPPASPRFSRTKIATLATLTCLVGFVIYDSLSSGHIASLISSIITWIENNPFLGVFVFACIYCVATILFVPGSVLTIGSGFAFARATSSALTGTLLAFLSVFIGATSGSLLAFLLARYLFRDAVVAYLGKQTGEKGFARYWNAIDAAMQSQGLKIMFLLRLSPLIPFNALNYVAGTSGVEFRDYAISMLGIVPGTVLFCFIGAGASDLSTAGEDGEGAMLKKIFLIVGGLFGFAAVFVVSYVAKKELNKSLEKSSGEEGLIGERVAEGRAADIA